MGGSGEMNVNPLLQASDLCKAFGGVQAVHRVSFDLVKGELLGLIGPNGSGKTTLVNLITGFVKPTSGKVVYRGQDITSWAPYRVVRLGIARTFQMVKPFHQLPAFKNIIIPLYSPRVKRLTGGRYGDRDAVALDLLEEVGFERDAFVAYKAASVLPQGYLKRLELAKAIALQPDLLILDELFSGLSLAEVASIVPIIEKLRQQGKTIVMIEHRLKELFRIADRVMVLNYGRKIAEGAAQNVMDSEDVKQAYLGSEQEGA
jgi:ABC-type branched-subunit amino acid transport system ATPase component